MRAFVEWQAHMHSCKRCKEVDEEKPSTLANLCLEGAKLIKPYLADRAAPALAKKRKAEREVYKRVMGISATSGPTTKNKVKAVMKYVD